MVEPRASNCSDIWKANSLVGVSTKAYNLCGLSSNVCRMGNANEPVFPEPVSAKPMISLPSQNKHILNQEHITLSYLKSKHCKLKNSEHK